MHTIALIFTSIKVHTAVDHKAEQKKSTVSCAHQLSIINIQLRMQSVVIDIVMRAAHATSAHAATTFTSFSPSFCTSFGTSFTLHGCLIEALRELQYVHFGVHPFRDILHIHLTEGAARGQ
eukprot:Colp12_sorted_trinity150504_noHs@4217